MESPTWSFSGIKLFEQCPRKYYHLKIARDYKEPETDAMLYGTLFHEAAELFVRGDADLPKRFSFARATLAKLKSMDGHKLCEYEMGLKRDLSPCTNQDPEVWFRGIADLVIIQQDVARVVDHKTGKSAKYADKDQLELMALAIFKHLPAIKKVKGGLLFVVCNAFIKGEYDRKDEAALWAKWQARYDRIPAAIENDVWNPKPSGLCRKHCIVTSCPHNGANM